ncbi:hypothetical protein LCGC14_1159440 [marine sediment metagenome]|uniref:Uncharacterized protein n=1 Tax=marine sediment metagenome TaxID=412755 RepID=A0A0F9LY60_9ZZZZ
MAKYASTTTVAPENSRAEIERVLKRYGADGFQYATQGNRAGVAFTVNKIMVKISLTLPSEADDEIRLDRWGGVDYEPRIKKRLDQALRQRWRALFLVVKPSWNPSRVVSKPLKRRSCHTWLFRQGSTPERPSERSCCPHSPAHLNRARCPSC